MATNPILPRAQAAIAGREPPTPEFRRFFEQLLQFVTDNGGTPEQISDIEARLAALEEAGAAILTGTQSVQVSGDAVGGYQLSLDGDDDAPGLSRVYGTDASGAKGFQPLPALAGCTLDGGGTAIEVGAQCDVQLPYAMTITRAAVLADAAGSIVVDVWADTLGNFPPDVSDSICAATPPSLSGAASGEDTTLVGWTVTLAAGTVLRFNVNSCSGIERATVLIEGIRA